MDRRSPIERMIDQIVVPISDPTDNRAEILLKIADAAKAWWESKRPVIYDREIHLDNPIINCSGKIEKDLALAVVEWVKIGG